MKKNFLLCEYFNARKQRLHRILIAADDDMNAQARTEEADSQVSIKRLAAEGSKAETPEQPPSMQNCAMAVQALIRDVTSEVVPLARARNITHVRVDFAKAVAVADVIPTLEASYGGHSASWARAIFRSRDSGPVGVH
jgi:hypothetical protein